MGGGGKERERLLFPSSVIEEKRTKKAGAIHVVLMLAGIHLKNLYFDDTCLHLHHAVEHVVKILQRIGVLLGAGNLG